MLIFWKKKLVFLANTKTGSTSIEMALESLAHVSIQRPPALKHTSATRYRRFVAPYLETSAGGGGFETVALIRDPIDWLGSWYRYRLREGLPIPANRTGEESFASFAEAYLSDDRPAFARLGSQAKFLTDREGKLAVDHLFRYEEIDHFLEFLEDRLGCEITLPHLNVSPEAPTELSAELEARLRERLAEDYALHGAAARG